MDVNTSVGTSVVVVWVRFVSVRHGIPVHTSVRISTGTIYFKRGSQVLWFSPGRSSFDSLTPRTVFTTTVPSSRVLAATQYKLHIYITEQHTNYCF
jgi:hypothetical protein